MDKYINKIICGDNMEVMATLPENSIDTIITDPPYGLGFMGKEWDTFGEKTLKKLDSHYGDGENKRPLSKSAYCTRATTAGNYDFSRNAEFQQWFTIWAKEVLRIAKPGAMMLVFGGTRTFHRLTCAIEDAGWQIRDCMMWLYGSGFPKSHDISKAIDKAKGAEREVVKQNPHHRTLKPTNTMVGEPHSGDGSITAPATDLARQWDGYGTALKPAWEPIIVAMKPLDGTFAQNAEKWGVGGLWIDGGRIGTNPGYKYNADRNGTTFHGQQTIESTKGRWPANLLFDEEAAELLGTPSRFFYCAKSSRSERNEGLEGMEEQITDDGREKKIDNAYLRGKTLRQNNHPTVKPLKLIEYLCKLTRTPAGGIVLDPFGGSGTTAVACQNTGRKYLLIEKDPHYCEIAEARVGQRALFE